MTLTNDTLTYAAVAGESNRVFVLGKLGGIRAIDTTASVTAGQGCVSLAAGEAFCAHKPSAVTSVILLGDMNDFVDLSTVGGGAVVSGGDGEDELGGAGGRTILDGGPGADTFHGGGSCRDVIDYSSRTNPVTVTIGDGLANDGESGEQDSIPATIGGVWGGHGNDAISYNGAVENCTQVDFSGRGGDDVLKARSFLSFLRGGAGDDTLTATVLASHLFGGPGDDVAIGGPGFQTFRGDEGDDDLDGRGGGDVLNGAEGVDRLLGGPGHDRLLGGPGPDTLLSRDDTTDRVVGGGGHDRARVDRRLDRIQSIEEFF